MCNLAPLSMFVKVQVLKGKSGLVSSPLLGIFELISRTATLRFACLLIEGG